MPVGNACASSLMAESLRVTMPRPFALHQPLFLFALLALFLMAGSPLPGQEPIAAPTVLPAKPSLEQKLREARFDLQVGTSGFTGSGAPVLNQAITEAPYVLIGEDHATREIPRFTTAVCDLMAKQGLLALAMEVGPQAAQFVTGTLGKPDRLAEMAALQKRYPSSAAFVDFAQENDLVEHASQAAGKAHFQFWGLDQEFFGAGGWLLDEILATKPGPQATAALQRLRTQEQQAAAQARETGDPSKLFLYVAKDAELAETAALLHKEGSPAANASFHELIVSHEIYLKNSQGDQESNAQRARLLKEHLRQHLEAAAAAGQNGKVLAKFGALHFYKGFNPLQQRDLGNYIAEVADGQGARSLHIAVFGAKGTHIGFAGYGRPYATEPFVLAEVKGFRWLKPLLDNQVQSPDAWTLYDLRRLRFQGLGDAMDADLKSLVYGYDLLVIIPELTPGNVAQ